MSFAAYVSYNPCLLNIYNIYKEKHQSNSVKSVYIFCVWKKLRGLCSWSKVYDLIVSNRIYVMLAHAAMFLFPLNYHPS